jgi:hypothetical protein
MLCEGTMVTEGEHTKVEGHIAHICEVWCTTRFVGFHQWKNAPTKFLHLRYPHRHEFHVKVSVYVKQHDREVEFQDLKRVVEDIISGHVWRTSSTIYPIDLSCENMAKVIGTDLLHLHYKPSMVEVSEDGENGGKVTYDYSRE